MTRFMKITLASRLLLPTPRMHCMAQELAQTRIAFCTAVERGACVLQAHNDIAWEPNILECIYPER